MQRLSNIAVLLIATCAASVIAADARGSSDHPLLPNRMPGFSISNYKQLEFSSHKFQTLPPKEVEGKLTTISYYLDKAGTHPGGLAIRRNYENALKAVGGEVVRSNPSFLIMKVKYNGVETWVEIQAPLSGSGRYYWLRIVEMTKMAQVITADAMAAELNKAGFIALDVHFATAKADILPESQPLIEQMAEMMRKSAGLRVGVEGHTDNTGTPATNMTLSTARAKSVTAALVAAGIAAGRLIPAGFGDTRPVADNRTEEGRAKNRRVELVKK
jgi:outer membrane protein OmpA-like peptidoglycan-associated protein